MVRALRIAFALSAIVVLGASAPRAPSLRPLQLPIDCRVGATCFVQQYFDHDPGPAAKDYLCGGRVYDGHDGVDIRLPSTAAQRRGVAVLAVADGTIKAARDGVADHVLETDADRNAIKGRECGNGVVINHGGGWESQVCHLAKGSIRVAPGQQVRAGDRLGLVGLSGETQFPHVHLSIRKDQRKVDPFAPAAASGACSRMAGSSLWSAPASAALQYEATEIINAGFADSAVTMAAIEDETHKVPNSAARGMVFFGRAIGLQAGDRMQVKIIGPNGINFIENALQVDRAKAQLLLFAGKKRPDGGWAKGRYSGIVSVVRNGQTVVRKTGDLVM